MVGLISQGEADRAEFYREIWEECLRENMYPHWTQGGNMTLNCMGPR